MGNHTEQPLARSWTAARRELLWQKKIFKRHLTEDGPSKTVSSTKRKEADKVEILSGVFEGRTAAPILF